MTSAPEAGDQEPSDTSASDPQDAYRRMARASTMRSIPLSRSQGKALRLIARPRSHRTFMVTLAVLVLLAIAACAAWLALR